MATLEPIVFYGNDGAEYRFGLTNSRAMGLIDSGFAEQSAQKQTLDFFWAALLNPNGLTKTDFIDNMPTMDSELMLGLAEAINQQFADRKADPRNDKFRPTKTGEPQLIDGLSSPDGTVST